MPDGLEELRAAATEELYERMGARLNDSTLSEQQLHELARQELATIIGQRAKKLTAEQRRFLIDDLADDVLGLGPLQRLLDDPSITEIMVNGPDHIYVERKGRLAALLELVPKRGTTAPGDRAHRLPGRAAHRRIFSPRRCPAPRRVPRQRDHPAARVQRLVADHPQVRRTIRSRPAT